jgi:hypothetical protein
MSKLALAIACIAIAGCAYHPAPQNVYGGSGKAYTAPSLCAALVQCQNASETACYYDVTKVTDATGKVSDEASCKEVKK